MGAGRRHLSVVGPSHDVNHDYAPTTAWAVVLVVRCKEMKLVIPQVLFDSKWECVGDVLV